MSEENKETLLRIKYQRNEMRHQTKKIHDSKGEQIMLVGNLFQNHPREVTCKKMNNMRGKGISKILSDQSAIRGT